MSEPLTKQYSEIVGTIFVGGEWQDHDLLEAVGALEAKLSKMERQIELAQNAMVRTQPTTHELDGAIVIWEVAWNELEEALAGGDDDLSKLATQQKLTEEDMERN